MDIHTIGNMFLTTLLPLIWTSFGPTVTVAITAAVNSVIGAYVPRPVQLILAAIGGAVVAGLTSPVGVDPTTAASMGGVASLGMQTGLMLNGRTFLSSAPGGK